MTTSTQYTPTFVPESSGAATVPLRFEVTTLPVADIDRAKAFYAGLGWRVDIDFKPAPDKRAVQMTPPGSPASIQFSEDGNGPVGPLYLIVEDIVAAREELARLGADVTEVWHTPELANGQAPGPDPQRRSYFSYAVFADPDGNTWLMQEVTERIPGRGGASGNEALSQLLLETAQHHDAFEKAAPPHDWQDWYAAYMNTRENGSTPDEAAAAAGRYMAEVKHIVV